MIEEKELSEEQKKILAEEYRKQRRRAGLPFKTVEDIRDEVMNMSLPKIKREGPPYLVRTRFLALKIINEYGMVSGKKDGGAINTALNFLRLDAGKPFSDIDGRKIPAFQRKTKPDRYVFGEVVKK